MIKHLLLLNKLLNIKIILSKNLKDKGINLYDIKYYTRKDSRYNNINNSIYFKHIIYNY